MSKQERIKRLVELLRQAREPMTAHELARVLGTSERSVRTYISDLTADGYEISASTRGYTLKSTIHSSDDKKIIHDANQDNEQARIRSCILQLVNASEPLSIYDIANDLYISDSTFLSIVVPQARRFLERFSLKLEIHQAQITLIGAETQKRKLLGYLAMQHHDRYFTSDSTLEQLFPQFDVMRIQHDLVSICQRAELLINDFALQNLLIHVMVIIGRLQLDMSLPATDIKVSAEEILSTVGQREAIVRCASDFAQYVARDLGIELPAADYEQLLILLALTSERITGDILTHEQVSHIVNPSFALAVRQIMDKMVNRFGLPEFDGTIEAQLTLHMYNALQRQRYHVSYPNPLGELVKSDYAPVYDLAVYFTHSFGEHFGAQLSENETAFVAFHIGSYLERVQNDHQKLRGIVVQQHYYSLDVQLLDRLKKSLSDELIILGTMSADTYLTTKPQCDVVITTQDIQDSDVHVLRLGPFATDASVAQIRSELGKLIAERKRENSRGILAKLMRPELYFEVQTLDLSSRKTAQLLEDPGRSNEDDKSQVPTQAEQVIELLCEKAQDLGLISSEFIEDVLRRERASSTAFVPLLAVPHALTTYAHQSFIAVLHTHSALDWCGKPVNFVLLIGVAEQEMKEFRLAFDAVIEAFSDVKRTARIATSSGYTEFMNALTSAAQN